MEQCLISVIVPVYKVEAYLDKCISSIVNQTYQNLEIILVDDGSPDNCPAMCDAWAVQDDRIRVIHKSNGGLSDARNAGMAAAGGELIGFVDSDDWISEDMYQTLYENMMKTGSDIAACGVEMVWEDGREPCALTKPGCRVLDREEAMRAILEESWLKQPVWYKLYKSALVKDLPFPVGKYHEDVFWSYQAVARAARVAVLDRMGYYYLQRNGSIMGKAYSLSRLDAIEAKAERQRFLEEHFPEVKENGCIDLFFSLLYHGQRAIRELDKNEQIIAVNRLVKVLDDINATMRSIHLPIDDKVWYSLSRVSFTATCRIRNLLGLGV